MAEWIMEDFKEKLNLNIKVKSVGIFAMKGQKITDNARSVLKELGIEVKDEKSRQISKEDLEWADLILAMSRGHRENIIYLYPDMKEKVYLLKEYSYGLDEDIGDPFGGDIERYRMARDEIYESIDNMLKTKEEFKW